MAKSIGPPGAGNHGAAGFVRAGRVAQFLLSEQRRSTPAEKDHKARRPTCVEDYRSAIRGRA